MLKELQQHLRFSISKKDQHQKSKYLSQTLSKLKAKKLGVGEEGGGGVMIKLIEELQLIIWIKNQLLDFTCGYFST